MDPHLRPHWLNHPKLKSDFQLVQGFMGFLGFGADSQQDGVEQVTGFASRGLQGSENK